MPMPTPMYPLCAQPVTPCLPSAPQAFHGLAVTLVYKYADAIVKNFANSSASASRFSASLRPPTPPTRPCVVPATALLV